MKIIYWEKLISDKEILEKYSNIVEKLLSRDYKATGLELKKSRIAKIYSARINHSDRLLFTTVTVNNQSCLCLLEAILNHKYKNSKFLNDSKALKPYIEKKINSLNSSLDACSPDDAVFDFEEISDEASYPVINFDIPTKAVYQPTRLYNDAFIILDETQNECLHLKLPAIISGRPGSGKSCLAIAMLSDKSHKPFLNKEGDLIEEGEMLYVTGSTKLADKIKGIYVDNAPTDSLIPRHRAVFMTYSELLLRYAPWLSEHRCVGEENFKNWFEDKAQTKNLPEIFRTNEYSDLSGRIYKQFRIMERNPDRQSLMQSKRKGFFSHDDAATYVYKVYCRYQANLEEKRQYDITLYEMPKNTPSPTYTFIFVDESQNFSSQQIDFLKWVAGDQQQICYALDPSQNMEDSDRKDFTIKEKYADGSYTLSIVDLPNSYRCPPNIIQFANFINGFKQALVDHSRRTEPTAISSLSTEGILRWQPIPQKLTKEQEYYRQEAQHPNFAVITLEKYKIQAKEFFNTSLCFTPDEAQGFEYETIVIFRMIGENKVYQTISNRLDGRPLSEKNDHYVNEISRLYTAVTRSTKNLVFMDKSTKKTSSFMDPIKKYLTDTLSEEEMERSKSNAPISTDDIKKQWFSEAKKLYLNGAVDQSKDTISQWELGNHEVLFGQWDKERELETGLNNITIQRLPNNPEPNSTKNKKKRRRNQRKPDQLVLNAPEQLSQEEIEQSKKTISQEKLGNYEELFQQWKKESGTGLSNIPRQQISPNELKPNSTRNKKKRQHNNGKPRQFVLIATKNLAKKIKEKPKLARNITSEKLFQEGAHWSLFRELSRKISSHTILEKIFEDKEDFAQKVTGEILYSSLNTGPDANASTFLFLCKSSTGIKLLLWLFEKNPSLIQEITADNLYSTFSVKPDPYTSPFYYLCSICDDDEGAKTLLMLCRQNPSLIQKMRIESLYAKNEKNPNLYSPLILLSKTESGVKLLKLIAVVNKELFNEITADDLFSVVKNGPLAGTSVFYHLSQTSEKIDLLENYLPNQKHPLIPRVTYECLVSRIETGDFLGNSALIALSSNGTKGIKLLNLILSDFENKKIVQQITIDDLCLPLSNFNYATALYFLSKNFKGIQLLLFLLNQKPSLIQQITANDLCLPRNIDPNLEDSIFMLLSTTIEGRFVLSLLIEKNKNLAQGITINDLLYIPINKTHSPLYRLSCTSEGCEILHELSKKNENFANALREENENVISQLNEKNREKILGSTVIGKSRIN